jgi:hypothetical protein
LTIFSHRAFLNGSDMDDLLGSDKSEQLSFIVYAQRYEPKRIGDHVKVDG